jgi:hypothetical protein
LRIDNIDLSALADLNLRHHVPDEFEVHLRHADTSIAATGQRKSHIGFGVIPKIDITVVFLT